MTTTETLKLVKDTARNMSGYYLERTLYYRAKDWSELAESMRASAQAYKLMEGVAEGLDSVKANDRANAWLAEHAPAKGTRSAD